ncbi:MAG: alcohol dehydrogenase catalytic domain-containing protein [Deltaproteobacteria bacterium]|nr:alcohol dehydrogenase catalytic domain-containing protein [Deltaproteobacteria bacterium]
MKAAILIQPGKLEIREVRTPCPAGGVLVKVKACGICSADAKMVTQGHRALNYPRILGHEIAGVIEQSRTNTFKEGDRIQIAPGLRCSRCSYCLNRTAALPNTLQFPLRTALSEASIPFLKK